MLEILFLHFNGYGSWVKIYADVLEKLRCSQQWQRSLLPSQNQPSGCLSQVSFWAAWSLLNSTTVSISIILLPTPIIFEAVILVIHLIQICLCGSIQVNVYLYYYYLYFETSQVHRGLWSCSFRPLLNLRWKVPARCIRACGFVQSQASNCFHLGLISIFRLHSHVFAVPQ